MPVYEFVCPACKARLEIMATLAEKETGLKPICPRCGFEKMIPVFGGFTIGSSRNRSGGSFCPPTAGPGCCG